MNTWFNYSKMPNDLLILFNAGACGSLITAQYFDQYA